MTHDWLLRYHPFGGKTELLPIVHGEAQADNQAAMNPQIVAALEAECFARMELAKRLSVSKRIYAASVADHSGGLAARH